MRSLRATLRASLQIDPFDGAKPHPLEWGIKRPSELALSEAEGVNPEQASAFGLGSRRVEIFSGFLPEKACRVSAGS